MVSTAPVKALITPSDRLQIAGLLLDAIDPRNYAHWDCNLWFDDYRITVIRSLGWLLGATPKPDHDREAWFFLELRQAVELEVVHRTDNQFPAQQAMTLAWRNGGAAAGLSTDARLLTELYLDKAMPKTQPFQNTWLYDVTVGQVVDHLLQEGDRGIVFRPQPSGLVIVDSDRLRGMGTYDPVTKTYVESPI